MEHEHSDVAQADTCYRHPGVIGAVGCQRCGRRICPQCMTSASVGFHCPECVKGGGQKVYTASTLPTSDLFTKAMVAINAAIFLIGMSSSSTNASLRFDFGLIGRARANTGELIGVGEGEVWRLVTSGFLHGGFIHVGFNMYLLWQLGRGMENRLGTPRFSALYMASMLGGSFAVMLLDPTALTIGASGAVFGLMGALMVMQFRSGMNPFDGGIGPLVAINLGITFVVPNISIGGHVGGLAAGALIGLLYHELDQKKQPAMVGFALAILLGVLFFVGGVVIAGR